MGSQQAERFAQSLAAILDDASAPGLSLNAVRDIWESVHVAGTEPTGVTYAEVNAGGVPALWCIPADSDSECVLLYGHAGGSVIFSMNSDRKAAAHLAKAAGISSLVVDFRRSPEHKFPSQENDLEAAYRWLLSQGYRHDNIVNGGHSIGGNLSVRLAAKLRDQGDLLPAAILAVSSWCDMNLKNETLRKNAETDKVLSVPLLEFFRESWIGGTGIGNDDPRVNLLRTNLTGLPPMKVYYGTHELLVGEIVEFAARAEAAQVDVSVDSVPEGQHLFLLGAGRVPETDAAIAEMGQWIRSKLTLGPAAQ
ncbi:alpha/beta hydrolase fold domain-containing protein [Streptomyces sp. NPDC004096]